MSLNLEQGAKRCGRCGEAKAITDFYVSRKERSGVQSSCKECTKKRTAAYRKANPEKRKRWQEINRIRSYGIEPHEYEAMYVAQSGCCAICTRRLPTLSIDHDHTTGEVRGLLCPPCNSAIGFLREDPFAIQRALEYVQC